MDKSEQILLVDDDPGMIQVLGRVLSGTAQVRFATGGLSALQQLRQMPADLVLLDAEMPGMNGYQVCEAMRADPALAAIPVIFVTSHSDADFELKGLEVGAVDFISKPISEPLLLARVRTHMRIKRLTDELRRIAAIDALTQVLNRRSFDAALGREWKRALRNGDPISLLMIDVDHFKRFNDRYGHPAGDLCLRSVAQVLRDCVRRPADVVARFGGEEFAVLLPQTTRFGAQHVAHRVLDAIEAQGTPHEESQTAGHVTVSIGVASLDPDSRCWPSQTSHSASHPGVMQTELALLTSADKALYRAKAAGRAQAWYRDIDDADSPGLAQEISPWLRDGSGNHRGGE